MFEFKIMKNGRVPHNRKGSMPHASKLLDNSLPESGQLTVINRGRESDSLFEPNHTPNLSKAQIKIAVDAAQKILPPQARSIEKRPSRPDSKTNNKERT